MPTETERPKFEVWHMMMMGDSGSPAATMSRSFDWDNDMCRPLLDRSQLLASVVNWDEFHALLFVPRSLLSESVETKVKRNISKWNVRRVSFWNDCDEMIQQCLNNVQKLADSEDLLLCVEGQSESRVRCVDVSLNSIPGSSGRHAYCEVSKFDRFSVFRHVPPFQLVETSWCHVRYLLPVSSC